MLHYPEKYKRMDTPQVARFLTFSCYHNLPLFIDPFLCERFLFHLDQQRRSAPFELWAYVVMPNHVHLLVYANKEISIRKQIGIVKRKFALEATVYLKEKKPSLASELVTFDHDREIIRFWQPGGGYDRDLWTPKRIRSAIDYIHNNPGRAALVEDIFEYPWSSARTWADGSGQPIPVNPVSLRQL